MSAFADTVARCAVVASVEPATAEERTRVGSTETLSVTLGDEFAGLRLLVAPPGVPFSPPVVALPEPNGLAHVMRNGNLCYFTASSQVRMDWSRPVDVFDWAIRQAAAVAVAPESIEELVDELVFYWGESAADGALVWCPDPLPPGNQWIRASRHGNAFVVESRSGGDTDVLLLDVPNAADFARKVVAPARLREVDIVALFESALNRGGRKLFQQFRSSPAAAILLRVPHPGGPSALLGLVEVGGELVPASVYRTDDAFLRPRGGAGDFARPAIVVGCGAVGGHIPEELARAGFRNLTLVDPDTLNPENAYRHRYGSVLAFPAPKVEIVRAEVMARFGDRVAVEVHRARAEDVLPMLLEQHPNALVIGVPGDATAYTIITRIARDHENVDLALGWLEPYGVAGHVMVTAPGRLAGCYDCLYEAPDVLGCVVDVVAPGQRLTVRMAGCGQVFTPFASVDALEVATELVRVAADLAVAPLGEAHVISWRRSSVSAPSHLRFSDRAIPPADGQRVLRLGPDFAPPTPCPTCGAWA